jgi:hypothetical protein
MAYIFDRFPAAVRAIAARCKLSFALRPRLLLFCVWVVGFLGSLGERSRAGGGLRRSALCVSCPPCLQLARTLLGVAYLVPYFRFPVHWIFFLVFGSFVLGFWMIYSLRASESSFWVSGDFLYTVSSEWYLLIFSARPISLVCSGDVPTPVAGVVRDGAIASVKKFLGTLALVDGAIALVNGPKLCRMKR